MTSTAPVRESTHVDRIKGVAGEEATAGPTAFSMPTSFSRNSDAPTKGETLLSGAVWLFPGLGSRYVGMGSDLFGRCAAADELIREAEGIVGYDIREVCLEGSGRKIVPSRQEAQVIYVISCAYGRALRERNHKPVAVAGHSLGNWAACHVAGLYDFRTGLELVTEVERLLEEAVPAGTQTMGVVIGLDEATVEGLCASQEGVQIANWNSPGQYIIGGASAGVDGVLAQATQLGAKRARRMPTDRALHTPLMRDVSARLRETLAGVTWSEPKTAFVSTQDSRVLNSVEEIREFLGEFLDLPVRWEAAVQGLCRQSGREFIEVGPGNVLASMFPFIDRTAQARSVSDLLEQDVTP